MVDGDKAPVSQTKSARTATREAFCLDFAKETRKRYPNLVLMLTGGFRSRAGAEAAIKESACDIVGMARPAAINPRLPKLFLEDIAEEDAQITLNKVRPGWLPKLLRSQALGAGAETKFSELLNGRRLADLALLVLIENSDPLCEPVSPGQSALLCIPSARPRVFAQGQDQTSPTILL